MNNKKKKYSDSLHVHMQEGMKDWVKTMADAHEVSMMTIVRDCITFSSQSSDFRDFLSDRYLFKGE